MASMSETSAQKSSTDDVNPFHIPQHNSLFQMMDKEKSRKKLDQQRKLALPGNEMTRVSQMSGRQSRLIKELKERESNTAVSQQSHQQLLDKLTRRISMMKDHNIDKGSIHEYVSKKRELFLMEYSLAQKREEIQLLEQKAIEEDKKLSKAEKLLDESTIMFEDFLKENDKNTVEAMKIAEQETKVKLDKMTEIKKITSKIEAVKRDISKYEDILNEYKQYEEFLRMLSQPERCRSTSTTDTEATSDETQTEKIEKTSAALSRNKSGYQSNATFALETDISGDEKEPEVFFEDPQELLDIMAELEEQTLSLIQNTRDREESLEDFKQAAELTQKKIESETKQLKDQIDVMTDTIQWETEKTAQLEQKCKLFGFGKYKPEEQDNTLDMLIGKVQEVHRCCVGETAANLSTLQMLTNIESKLVELQENADMIPRERMSIAERAQEKERRIRLRDEKIHLQMMRQEEKQKKALERSRTDKISKKKI